MARFNYNILYGTAPAQRTPISYGTTYPYKHIHPSFLLKTAARSTSADLKVGMYVMPINVKFCDGSWLDDVFLIKRVTKNLVYGDIYSARLTWLHKAHQSEWYIRHHDIKLEKDRYLLRKVPRSFAVALGLPWSSRNAGTSYRDANKRHFYTPGTIVKVTKHLQVHPALFNGCPLEDRSWYKDRFRVLAVDYPYVVTEFLNNRILFQGSKRIMDLRLVTFKKE